MSCDPVIQGLAIDRSRIIAELDDLEAAQLSVCETKAVLSLALSNQASFLAAGIAEVTVTRQAGVASVASCTLDASTSLAAAQLDADSDNDAADVIVLEATIAHRVASSLLDSQILYIIGLLRGDNDGVDPTPEDGSV